MLTAGPAAAAGIKLAQAGDVEIYYRRAGPARHRGRLYGGDRIQRRTSAAHCDAIRGPERYYLDDPEDMERLRRDQDAEIYRVPAPRRSTARIWRDRRPRRRPAAAPFRGFLSGPRWGPPLTGRDPRAHRARAAAADDSIARPGHIGVVIIEPNSQATIEPPVTSAARRRWPNCKSCSTAWAPRLASSTDTSAAMSTRRLPPTGA